VTEVTDALHEDQYTLLIMPHSVLLKMRNVSDKFVDKITTHIPCSVFFFKSCYEITWKNTAEPDRSQMIIWRMNIACWIPNATGAHSEYVILIALLVQH